MNKTLKTICIITLGVYFFGCLAAIGSLPKGTFSDANLRRYNAAQRPAAVAPAMVAPTPTPTQPELLASTRTMLLEIDKVLATPEPTPESATRPAVFYEADMKASFQSLLERESPGLNWIKTSTAKNKKGVALWGSHEYFGQYSFSIGGLGPAVSQWVAANRDDLKRAGIVRVGVRNAGGYAGSTYFDVQ